MRQQVGYGAAIAVAMAAAIGVTTQMKGGPATPQETRSTSRPSGYASELNPSAASEFAHSACAEIEDHIQNFLAISDRDKIVAPDSCYSPLIIPPKGAHAAIKKSRVVDASKGSKAPEIQQRASHLQFMIATLPDPTHTHFPLEFDRMTEALQQAASDEFYVYDSSWLPWSTQDDKYNRVQDQDLADDRRKAEEEQPGILLFRRTLSINPNLSEPASRETPYSEGMVVFLVGEEPTQGIHREQFRNATAWIAALQGTPNSGHILPSRILGPSFSGSMPSLVSLIAETSNQPSSGFNGTPEDGPIQVYSGNVAGDKATSWFENEAKSLHVSFASFQQSDHFLMSRYCEYLKQSSFNLERLAILSEDQTAYGSETVQLGLSLPAREAPGSSTPVPKSTTSQQPEEQELDLKSCNLGYKATEGESNPDGTPLSRPARLFYPRDISALRTAYQKESIFRSQPAAADTSQRTLTSDLADPEGKQHDSIRSYAGDQTALSEEAVLQQIVSELRVHKSEFIMLRSSNVLDQIFLCHYLRLAYPEGRIVILGADQLLRRESGATRLSGIMTLTTYPLLPWEPHWTRRVNDAYAHSHRVFARDRAEGTYIAARFLLHPSLRISAGQDRESILLALHDGGYQDVTAQKKPLNCSSVQPPVQLAPNEFKGAYALAENCVVIQARGFKAPSKSVALVSFKENKVDRIINEHLESVTEYTRPMLPVAGFTPNALELPLADYRAPFWMDETTDKQKRSERVPAWLSVLGRTDFWPIAAMTETSVPCESLVEMLKEETDEAKPSHGSEKPAFHPCLEAGTAPARFESRKGTLTADIHSSAHSLSRAIASLCRQSVHWGTKGYGYDEREQSVRWPPMTLSIRISMLLAVIWGLFHFFCCIFPSVTKKPSHRAHFVCVGDRPSSYHALMVLAGVTLFAVATVLTWGFGGMSPDGQPLPHGQLWCAFLPLFWLLIAASLIGNLWRQIPSAATVDRPSSDFDLAKPLLAGSAAAELEGIQPPPQTSIEESLQSGKTKMPLKLSFREQVELNWPRIYRPFTWFLLGSVAFYLVFYISTEASLDVANRIPTYWRAMNMTSGVSPLVPLLAFGVGLYLWFWYSMQGLALIGNDRPSLPPLSALRDAADPDITPKPEQLGDVLRMFSQEDAAQPVEELWRPFARSVLYVGIGVFVFLSFITFYFSSVVPFRSLGARSYSYLICSLMNAFFSIMLANAWQFLNIWVNLRQLLTHLDRLPLRRSMGAFPGVSWNSVWSISGNVLDLRYTLLTSQLTSLTHLKNCLAMEKSGRLFHSQTPGNFWAEEFLKLGMARKSLANWYAKFYSKSNDWDQTEICTFQQVLARLAGILIVKMLVPEWQKETADVSETEDRESERSKQDRRGRESTSLSGLDCQVRHAEQFVCYVYLGFIQNVMGRMRSLATSILWMFLAVTVAMSSYPFDPRPAISGAIVLLFAVLSVVIVTVYAQMHRDPVLSLVTKTDPGELGADFWLKLLGFGAGPVLGLLTAIFPQLTDSVFSWIEPGLSSFK